jgi:hypothetical protein
MALTIRGPAIMTIAIGRMARRFTNVTSPRE